MCIRDSGRTAGFPAGGGGGASPPCCRPRLTLIVAVGGGHPNCQPNSRQVALQQAQQHVFQQ
eukprot:2193955-Pyramimonas_sp.AAC.1